MSEGRAESGHRSGFERQEYRAQDLVEALESAILTAPSGLWRRARNGGQVQRRTGRVDLFQIIIVADPVSTRPRRSRSTRPSSSICRPTWRRAAFQIFFDEKDSGAAEEQDANTALLKLNRPGRLRSLRRANRPSSHLAAGARSRTRQRVQPVPRKEGELISGIVRALSVGSIIVDLGVPRRYCRCASRCRAKSFRAGTASATATSTSGARPADHHFRATRACWRSFSRWRSRDLRQESCGLSLRRASRVPLEDCRQLTHRDVDPVGACVGMKARACSGGAELRARDRHRALRQRPARFVCNAIAPAQVSRVMIDASKPHHGVGVRRQAFLGHRKKGQNVRLASQLTNWRIDIHSETKMREAEERAGFAHRRRGGHAGNPRGAAAPRVGFGEPWPGRVDELATLPGWTAWKRRLA